MFYLPQNLENIEKSTDTYQGKKVYVNDTSAKRYTKAYAHSAYFKGLAHKPFQARLDNGKLRTIAIAKN